MSTVIIGRDRLYAYSIDEIRKSKLFLPLQIAIECQWAEAMEDALAAPVEDANYVGGRVAPKYVARSMRQGKTIKQIKAMIPLILSVDGIQLLVNEIHYAAETNFIYQDRQNRG